MRFLSLLTLSLMGISATCTAAEKLVGESDKLSLDISIYNQNLALVKDVRKVSLEQGVNDIAFEGVAEKIKSETAILYSDGLTVLEQNYDYDLLTANNIVDKYENIMTFFADVCCVDEKGLLEFIFESFGLLNENCFNEIEFIKGIIYHKYEQQVVCEVDDLEEEEFYEEEEPEETSKVKGLLALSGVLIVLAFWFSFMCKEELKYSMVGMVTCLLAVGLIGYVVLKSILEEVKKGTI